jgi:N-acetylglucosamine kinase-like BadF-type ATPase
MGLVVGLDAGGTSTRALVLDLDGNRLGTGLAGGANPNSHPPEHAAAQITSALRVALEGLDTGKVESGVLGIAGASKLTDPAVAALFEAAWRDAGLRCPVRVVTDCEAAFAAGTAQPDGTVLVAGTGSIAARIRGHRLVHTAGGHGWLLGDEGSAFWLGREAVRATLRVLETSGKVSGIVEAVLRRTSATTRSELITAVNAAPPIRLAELAPLVTAALAAGDALASRIVADAARLLADLAMQAREPGETTPVVLVGSLVSSPVGACLKKELAARAVSEVRVASEGAAGAAWLAAVDVLGPSAPRPS